jgi:hypothetical protein
MWYDEAETYVFYGILIASAFLCWSLYRHNSIIRTASLMALAFGVGLNLGIERTAKGSFYLPLGVMQKQMHEQWGLPMQNLLRPVDRDTN